MNYAHPLNVLYFGCWTGKGAGHYLWTTLGAHIFPPQEFPWKGIDCVLQPGADPDNPYKRRQEVEGHAALHHLTGWTAICFWDRSEDQRGGCNSNFFAHGTFTFDEMLRLAQAHFPIIMARFKFTISLVIQNSAPVADALSLEEKAADYARVVGELETLRRKLKDTEISPECA